MAIDIAELWNGRSQILTSPDERKKAIVLGVGVATTIVVLIVVIALVSTGGGRETKGRDVLKTVPLIIGFNNLPDIIRQKYKNDLSNFQFENNENQCPECHTDLNRLQTGEVGGVFWGVGAPCEHPDAVQETLEQIDLVQRLIKKYSKDLQFITEVNDVELSVSEKHIVNLLGLTGGHLIDSRLALIRTYKNLGVKYMTIIGGCKTPWANDNLNEFGRKVIKELNRNGILIDLSGSSEEIQHAVMVESKAPIIFSNSAAFFLCEYDNNIPDETLRGLRYNGGVFMLSLNPDYICGTESWRVLDQLTHIANTAGIDHIGLSAGNVNNEHSIFSNISSYPLLFDLLYTNNSHLWSMENLSKLAGGNILRVLKASEQIESDLSNEIPEQQWISSEDFVGFGTKCRSFEDVSDNPIKTTETTRTTTNLETTEESGIATSETTGVPSQSTINTTEYYDTGY